MIPSRPAGSRHCPVVDTVKVTSDQGEPDPSEFLDPLTAHDRCDRCGSQAYVRVAILGCDGTFPELLFCGHHFAEHERALLEGHLLLAHRDERHRIGEPL